MSLRAVFIGLLLGLMVASITYFNDHVAHSTFLVGNQFPVGVFGALMLLLLVVNPLLARLKKPWRLRPGELALITALGLAVCGWPGSGFFRIFSPDLAMPSKLLPARPDWQAAHVMSYVPGASAQLGMGHLHHVPDLAAILLDAESSPSRPADRMVWERLPSAARQVLRLSRETGQTSDTDKHVLLNALNDVITDASFYRAFDPDELSDPARVVLNQRERLLAASDSLTARRDDVLRQRDALTAERSTELQQLDTKRKTLLARQAELFKQADEGARNRQTLKELDGELDHLDRQVANLRSGIDQLDNERQRLEAALGSLRRRTGSTDKTDARMTQAGLVEQHINRLVLVSLYPESISPPPAGGGVLPADGDPDPYVIDTLNQGWDGPRPLGLTQLPWKDWWPTLRLWAVVAVLTGIAFLCMTLIVHPQWSRRELLAYPIARFVEDITHTEADGRGPTMLRSRLFWYGFGALIFLHLVNGLNAWFPEQMFFQIPVTFNFSALGELFPNALRIARSPNLAPKIYLSVVAFAFFLNSDVSFSLGISTVAWGCLGAFCFSNGIAAEYDRVAGRELNLLLFGSGLGFAVMVLFIGRRYYTNVALSALGFRRRKETPGYAVWAARVFVICVTAAVLVLWKAGLDWPFALLSLVLILMLGFASARAIAESGLFFLHPGWIPCGVLLAFIGVDAVSPQILIMLALMSVVLVGDPRETIMPYLVNGLRMASGARRDAEASEARVRRAGPLLAMMVVLGFVVALGATFYLQYNQGLDHLDTWASRDFPAVAFNTLSSHVSKLSAHGRLVETTNTTGLDWVKAVVPDRKLMLWAAIGFGLVVACSIARLRLSWWFIHPVMFIFWGGHARTVFAASFLLGFLVKIAVVKLGGAKSYRNTKPLMVGIIAGELVAGVGWMLVSAVYWSVVGQAPTMYRLTPG